MCLLSWTISRQLEDLWLYLNLPHNDDMGYNISVAPQMVCLLQIVALGRSCDSNMLNNLRGVAPMCLRLTSPF